jgi:hypothetical protein
MAKKKRTNPCKHIDSLALSNQKSLGPFSSFSNTLNELLDGVCDHRDTFSQYDDPKTFAQEFKKEVNHCSRESLKLIKKLRIELTKMERDLPKATKEAIALLAKLPKE